MHICNKLSLHNYGDLRMTDNALIYDMQKLELCLTAIFKNAVFALLENEHVHV